MTSETALERSPRTGLRVAWLRGHPLAAYVFLAYGLSWAYRVPLVMTAGTAGAQGTVAAVVSTGVMVMAALVVWRLRHSATPPEERA